MLDFLLCWSLPRFSYFLNIGGCFVICMVLVGLHYINDEGIMYQTVTGYISSIFETNTLHMEKGVPDDFRTDNQLEDFFELKQRTSQFICKKVNILKAGVEKEHGKKGTTFGCPVCCFIFISFYFARTSIYQKIRNNQDTKRPGHRKKCLTS